MRVSNEPCVPVPKKSRCELAHIRDFFGTGTYGECRDINISFGAVRTSYVREPVGMAHCVSFCQLNPYMASFLLNSAPIFNHRISC